MNLMSSNLENQDRSRYSAGDAEYRHLYSHSIRLCDIQIEEKRAGYGHFIDVRRGEKEDAEGSQPMAKRDTQDWR